MPYYRLPDDGAVPPEPPLHPLIEKGVKVDCFVEPETGVTVVDVSIKVKCSYRLSHGVDSPIALAKEKLVKRASHGLWGFHAVLMKWAHTAKVKFTAPLDIVDADFAGTLECENTALREKVRALEAALKDCVAVMENDLRGLAVIQPELRQAKAALKQI